MANTGPVDPIDDQAPAVTPRKTRLGESLPPYKTSSVAKSEEYLTIAQLASRLQLSRKTIQNKMALGVFRKGEHYFTPAGTRPRFKWSAIVAWIEQAPETQTSSTDGIPMAKGYTVD